MSRKKPKIFQVYLFPLVYFSDFDDFNGRTNGLKRIVRDKNRQQPAKASPYWTYFVIIFREPSFFNETAIYSLATVPPQKEEFSR